MKTLREMLTYCRPYNSKHHARFVAQFVAPLPGAYADKCGNYHVHVDDAPVLWSCHTDTVHRSSDRQNVIRRGDLLMLAEGSKSACLGADDTAGVWLLRKMIRAKVPGHYIFHVGEERGGIGSRWLSLTHADWLSTFKCAIALDRAGTSDVITHQYGGRTASDTFATALAGFLGPAWCREHGVYTDTAEYADLIPECTNLSVGYEGAHTSWERLDTAHLQRLLETLLTLDVPALPIVRTPGDDGWNDTPYQPRHIDRYIDWTDDDPCESCIDLARWGLIGTSCPDCGRIVKDDDDDNVYLSREYSRVQRHLRLVQ